jgi:hypothetical protein
LAQTVRTRRSATQARREPVRASARTWAPPAGARIDLDDQTLGARLGRMVRPAALRNGARVEPASDYMAAMAQNVYHDDLGASVRWLDGHVGRAVNARPVRSDAGAVRRVIRQPPMTMPDWSAGPTRPAVAAHVGRVDESRLFQPRALPHGGVGDLPLAAPTDAARTAAWAQYSADRGARVGPQRPRLLPDTSSLVVDPRRHDSRWAQGSAVTYGQQHSAEAMQARQMELAPMEVVVGRTTGDQM